MQTFPLPQAVPLAASGLRQPTSTLQTSSVHALPSAQVALVPPMQAQPLVKDSPLVQGLPSLHAAPALHGPGLGLAAPGEQGSQSYCYAPPMG